MSDPTQELIIPYDKLPIQFQKLLHDNRDILNYIFSESFLMPQGIPYRKVAVRFRGKLDALDQLIDSRLLSVSLGQQREVHLTFFGLIFCGEKEAKDLIEVATKTYDLLEKTYIASEYKYSLKELTDKVYTFPFSHQYEEMESVLNYFGTAPFSPVTFNRVVVDIPANRSEPHDIQGTEHMLRLKSFNDYASRCLELLSTDLNKTSVIVKDPVRKDEPEYRVLEEELKLEGSKITNKEYKCFVIMPIGNPEKNLAEYKNNMSVFNKIVKPCVETSKYTIRCYYADDELFTQTGDIQKQIFDSIQNDPLVIVDLRRKNPNVVYEMCMRHYTKKRTILICSNLKDNFFHNDRYRAYQYSIDGNSNQRFHKQIQSAIEAILKDPRKFDNPISDFLGISPKTTPISKEEEWYRNEGGTLYNLYIQLKQTQLYLTMKDDYKLGVYNRANYKSWLSTLGEAIKGYSTEEIFKKDIDISTELRGLGDLIISFSDSGEHSITDELDVEIAKCAQMKLGVILKKLHDSLVKVGYYLIGISERKTELTNALDKLLVKFDRIEDDTFVYQKHTDIQSYSERFAKDFYLLSSASLFKFSQQDLQKCEEISTGLMSLYLRDVVDGGMGLKEFRNSFKSYTLQAKDFLNKL